MVASDFKTLEAVWTMGTFVMVLLALRPQLAICFEYGAWVKKKTRFSLRVIHHRADLENYIYANQQRLELLGVQNNHASMISRLD